MCLFVAYKNYKIGHISNAYIRLTVEIERRNILILTSQLVKFQKKKETK